MTSSEPASSVGTQFGPYRLLRLLGRGGMGEVYEAEDTRKRRSVALKLIAPGLSGDPAFRARMQREADAAGRLNEPHVVPIHDYGEIDGRMYVEMRLIDGENLANVLKRSGPLGPVQAVDIVEQIAAALDAAHAIGVTHRDIKPENIIISRDDFAYLVDFGIARAASDPDLTQTGTAVGTYNYMAPERFSGAEVDYRSDIYSLTCVLAECLIGAPPYRSATIERLIAAHLMEPAPRPSQLRPGVVPIALDQVIARGLAKNPRERYSSAGDLARAARDALTTGELQQAALGRRAGVATDAPGYAAAGAVGYAAADRGRPTDGYPAGAAAPAGFAETVAGPSGWRDTGSVPPSRPPAGPPANPQSAPPPAAPASGQRGRGWVLPGAAAAVAVLLAAGVGGYALVHRSGSSASSSATAAGQSVLAFDGLNFRLSPGGLALDSDDNVYVTNQSMYGRVVKLAPGSSSPQLLPFTGLYEPQGVAVDKAGAIYVTDFNNRVVKLVPESSTQTELPFTGLNYPEGLTVDAAGNVYVADRGNSRVVELPAGSNTQVVLPFTGLHNPDDVAVDKQGNVYVTDTDNDRVVKLAAGTNTQSTLPFTDLAAPWGVTVDDGGDVYVTNHESHKVMKLAAGTNAQTLVPFSGLNTPLQVVVGKDGAIYVADRGNNRVVKLAAGH